MNQRDYVVPLALLLAVAAFVAYQAGGVPKTRPAKRGADVASPTVTSQGRGVRDSVTPRASDTISLIIPAGDVTVESSQQPAPVFDKAYVSELVREGSPGTYLPEVLATQENALMRWPDRRVPMRVWIERDVQLADWNPEYPLVAERAFEEWQQAGFSLRFDMILERTSIDIEIRWIERFPAEEGQKIGVAKKVRDQHGWLKSAEISIATHDSAGRPLSAATVAGTMRHEIGHALGLGHSSNPADVMYPESRTPAISAADRKTLRLLYMLPPGRMP